MTEIDADDLTGWMEYEQQETATWRPDLLAFADLMAVVVNMLRAPGTPAVGRDAFLPHLVERERPLTPAEKAALVRAGGGIVLGFPALVSVTSDQPPG